MYFFLFMMGQGAFVVPRKHEIYLLSDNFQDLIVPCDVGQAAFLWSSEIQVIVFTVYPIIIHT